MIEKEVLNNDSIDSATDTNLTIDQKYLYLGESADLYYQSDTYELLNNYFIKLIRNFLSENKVRHLVSLGCGNSYEEITILQKIKKHVTYTGVDFSERMLELSKELLIKKKFENYNLIKSDFFNPELFHQSEVKRFFYVSGYTMCNLSADEWTILISGMKTGDYFCFYVLSIEDPFIYKDVIESSIDSLCDSPVKITQYLKGLKEIGLSSKDGTFVQSIDTDDLSVIIRYSFVLHSGNPVKVQDVRVYSIGNLIEFFEQRDFTTLTTKVINDTCLYIFQKN